MPRRRATAALTATATAIALAATTLVACNGPTPADLFLVQRAGSIPGAKLTLRVTDDGGAFCNTGKRVEITSSQLITARELRRELDGDDQKQKVGLAEKHLSLPRAPGSLSSYQYKIRSENGTVAFADTSKNQPKTFYTLAELTREIATKDCHLAR